MIIYLCIVGDVSCSELDLWSAGERSRHGLLRLTTILEAKGPLMVDRENTCSNKNRVWRLNKANKLQGDTKGT